MHPGGLVWFGFEGLAGGADAAKRARQGQGQNHGHAHCGARSPNGFLCYATSRLLGFLMSVCIDRDDGG